MHSQLRIFLRKFRPAALKKCFLIGFALYSVALFLPVSRAQDVPVAPTPKQDLAAVSIKKSDGHKFWDGTNAWLFAGTGASRTLDYFSTLNMRRRGRQEILLSNDAVDNHAASAAIEAAGTGVSIGASYLFHRYGHHKLERWTSVVHLTLATTGAARNYALKTAHPATTATP